MIEYILRQVKVLGAETFIVANDLEAYKRFDVPVHPDIEQGIGALGGIYSALSYAANNFVLVLACDMPFVNQPLYKHEMDLIPNYDAVVPILKADRCEPFRSVYAKSCLEAIKAAIDAGERRATGFLPIANTRFIKKDEVEKFDPTLISFFNINSPADFSRAEIIAQKFSL